MFIYWAFYAVSLLGSVVFCERSLPPKMDATRDMACVCRDERLHVIDPFEIKEARK